MFKNTITNKTATQTNRHKKKIHYSSIKHNLILIKYDCMFQSKKTNNQANITKTFKNKL